MTQEQRINANIDKILRAAGSAFKHHTMQKTKDDLRKAMREIMSKNYIAGSNAAIRILNLSDGRE